MNRFWVQFNNLDESKDAQIESLISSATEIINACWIISIAIFNSIFSKIKLNERSFQFIVQITLFQLQFLILYHKFSITVGSNLYDNGSKEEVFNINLDIKLA